MRISKKDAQLLLMVGGIIIAICTYSFVFLKLQDKTEVLERENVVLEDVIVKLKDLDKNREQYLEDTENFKKDNERIKEEFPAGMEEEDDILYVDGLEGTLAELYTSSLGMPSAVSYELAYPPVEKISVDEMLQGAITTTANTQETEAAADTAATETETEADAAAQGTDSATLTAEGVYPSCQLWYIPITTTYEVDYLSLKQLIKAVSEDNNKKSVEEVSVTYNEENGILTGSMTSNYYYLSGTDKAYNTPDVAGVPTGTSNPFRSVR